MRKLHQRDNNGEVFPFLVLENQEDMLLYYLESLNFDATAAGQVWCDRQQTRKGLRL